MGGRTSWRTLPRRSHNSRSKCYGEPCLSQLLEFCPGNTPNVCDLSLPFPGYPGKGRDPVPCNVLSGEGVGSEGGCGGGGRTWLRRLWQQRHTSRARFSCPPSSTVTFRSKGVSRCRRTLLRRQRALMSNTFGVIPGENEVNP